MVLYCELNGIQVVETKWKDNAIANNFDKFANVLPYWQLNGILFLDGE